MVQALCSQVVVCFCRSVRRNVVGSVCWSVCRPRLVGADERISSIVATNVALVVMDRPITSALQTAANRHMTPRSNHNVSARAVAQPVEQERTRIVTELT